MLEEREVSPAPSAALVLLEGRKKEKKNLKSRKKKKKDSGGLSTQRKKEGHGRTPDSETHLTPLKRGKNITYGTEGGERNANLRK